MKKLILILMIKVHYIQNSQGVFLGIEQIQRISDFENHSWRGKIDALMALSLALIATPRRPIIAGSDWGGVLLSSKISGFYQEL